MMRRTAIPLCIAAISILADAVLSDSLGQGSGSDRQHTRAYNLGRDGWSLERFGDRIAVLRTSVNQSPEDPASAGLLALSCEAGERRWRLSLPAMAPINPDLSTMLLRPPSPYDAYRIGNVRIAQGRVLTLAETGPFKSGVVSFFVQLLKADTPRVDLLLGARGAPRRSELAVIVLTPTLRRADLVAFDDFLASCSAQKR